MRKEPEIFEFEIRLYSERSAEMERQEIERRRKIREDMLSHRWKIFTRLKECLLFVIQTALILAAALFNLCCPSLTHMGAAFSLCIFAPFAVLGLAYIFASMYERYGKNGQGIKAKIVKWCESHDDTLCMANTIPMGITMAAILVYGYYMVCNENSPHISSVSYIMICLAMFFTSCGLAFLIFEAFNLIGEFRELPYYPGEYVKKAKQREPGKSRT